MQEKDIVITYETLFDLLRREKSRIELQKLDKGFFKDVVEYLKDKEKILTPDSQEDLFSFGEKEKAQKQLFNIKRILKELYDRREKKVLAMAMDKAKTGSNLVDTGSLLSQEKQLFDSIVNTLLLFRTEIVQKILESKDVKDSIVKTENFFDMKERQKEEKKLSELFKAVPDEEDTLGDFISEPSQTTPQPVITEAEEASEETSNTESNETPNEDSDSLLTLRFLQHVPRFVGLELEEYGPFDPDDMASIPEVLATVLIEKRRAELVSNS